MIDKSIGQLRGLETCHLRYHCAVLVRHLSITDELTPFAITQGYVVQGATGRLACANPARCTG